MISPLGSRYAIGGALGRSVKRASTGITDPTDIADLWIWYDFSDAESMFTDDGTTNVSSDGESIYRINDKSGNNLHARQATEAKRPTYKTNIQNGLSVGRGDGGDELVNDITDTSQPFTIFVVASVATDAVKGFAGGNARVYNYIGRKLALWAGSFITSATAFALNEKMIICGVLNTTNSVLYKNNTSIATGNIGTNKMLVISPFSNGLTGYVTGDIGELIYFNKVLSDDDRNKINTYLNNKWAIYS